MASKLLILAVLLAAVAAVTTATEFECRVGKSIPYKPLPACQEIVRKRCASDDRPVLKDLCCKQLQNIPRDCRCEVLIAMVWGVTEDGKSVDPMEVPAGCSRFRMANIAAQLPSYPYCNLESWQSSGQGCPIWGGTMY